MTWKHSWDVKPSLNVCLYFEGKKAFGATLASALKTFSLMSIINEGGLILNKYAPLVQYRLFIKTMRRIFHQDLIKHVVPME